jgi:hypothetical protein
MFDSSKLDHLMDEHLYRANKRQLRPRSGSYSRLPRWVWKMLHKAHPDAGTYYYGAWQVLHNDCSFECDPSGPGHFMDHRMISIDGRLVFEPYMDLDTARAKAAAYATRHDLQYSVSPTAWWNEACVRVEFWP